MSEEKNTDVIPDMDFDLDGVDTSRPVAAPGTYMAQLNFAVEPNKEKSGKNMVVTAVLQGEVFSSPSPIDGSQKQLENHKITTYMPLQAKRDAKDKDGFKKNLAALADACGGTDISTRPAKPDWNSFQNCIVMVEVATEETEKFGLQDRIVKFMHNPS